jgi:hypothetical protein
MTLLIKSTHPCRQTGQTLVQRWSKPLLSLSPPETFAVFSNFLLNTSKSTNIKVVRLFEGHTFHNWRHLRFWVEIAENLSQTQHSLFTGAMKDNNFACSLCSNHWAKHRPAFVKVVEGPLIYNFASCTLVHFSSSFWSSSQSNRTVPPSH